MERNKQRPTNDNRNQNQYWVFWPREAASKMVEKAAVKLENDISWDSSFNLTTSYRRDSDIPRPYGNMQVLLGNSFNENINRVIFIMLSPFNRLEV